MQGGRRRQSVAIVPRWIPPSFSSPAVPRLCRAGQAPYLSAMPQLHSATPEMYPPANGLARRNGRPPRRDPASAPTALAHRPNRGPSGRPEAKPAPNPFHYAHALLRGRYPLAIAAATVLGTLGGVAGYLSQTPMYASVGRVQVEPRVDRLVYTTDDNAPVPQYQFNNIINGQAAIIGSDAVARAAVDDPEWREAGWGTSTEAVALFRDAMDISVPRGGSIIQVAFESEDPEIAYAGVRSALNAYEVEVAARRTSATDKEVKELRERIEQTERRIEADATSLATIASTYGDPNLEDDIADLASRLRDLGIGIDQLKAAIDKRKAQEADAAANGWTMTDGASATQPSVEVPPVPEEEMRELAETNRGFAQQYLELLGRRNEIAIKEHTYAENSQVMKNLRMQLAQVEQSVYDSARFLLKTRAIEGKTTAELEEELAQLQRIERDLTTQRDNTSRASVSIATLQRQIREKTGFRDDLANELTKLETEREFSERVRVVDTGSLPTEPSEDKRLQIGAVGGLFGGMLGFGLVALWGLSDGRLRWLDDPRNSDVFRGDRILAALPDMQGGGLLAGEDDAVAFQLHKLRLSLQRAMRQDRRSFAITSPVSGDGKTSVTMALGLSLAASGTRTLLVDFDLVGKSLSRRFASKKGESGPSAIDRGLGAILRGTPVADCFLDTDVKRLSVLGCADAGSEDARRLSPKFARHVLREAMEHFEIVLVDTGPLLASLEANTIAAETDGSVLCISRGTDRKLVERSVELLTERSRSFEGVVVNRLDAGQFDKFVASTMSVSVPNDAATAWRGASARAEEAAAGGTPKLVTRTLDESSPAKPRRPRDEDEADS